MKKKILSVLAVSAALVGVTGLATANAGVIYQYGYSGSVPSESGTDAFGNPWVWGKTAGGAGVGGPGAGYSVWGTPGLGAGVGTYKGAIHSNDFEVTFLTPFTSTTGIYTKASPGPGGYNEYTRLTVDGIAWAPVYVNATTVAFFAPTGDYATTGSEFFANIVFDGKNLSGANSGFSATWSLSGVPEVSTWAMMLAGFAGLGFVGYRRQKPSIPA